MFGWISEAFGAVTDWALTDLGGRDIEPPMTGAMRAFLLDDPVIAGLVVTRVYPLRLPQKPTLPAIVIQRVSDVREAHLRGINALARARYQVDCWCDVSHGGHDGATALGQYVARRLSGFSGTWTTTSSPAQSVSVTVFPDVEQDLFEEEIQGGLCRHSADYFLYHRLSS